jgi:hypothetical protein
VAICREWRCDAVVVVVVVGILMDKPHIDTKEKGYPKP